MFGGAVWKLEQQKIYFTIGFSYKGPVCFHWVTTFIRQEGFGPNLDTCIILMVELSVFSGKCGWSELRSDGAIILTHIPMLIGSFDSSQMVARGS